MLLGKSPGFDGVFCGDKESAGGVPGDGGGAFFVIAKMFLFVGFEHLDILQVKSLFVLKAHLDVYINLN